MKRAVFANMRTRRNAAFAKLKQQLQVAPETLAFPRTIIQLQHHRPLHRRKTNSQQRTVLVIIAVFALPGVITKNSRNLRYFRRVNMHLQIITVR